MAHLLTTYKVVVFTGVQAMTRKTISGLTRDLRTHHPNAAFLVRFGTCSAATGKCTIPAYIISIMNSFPYLGKLLVCITILGALTSG